MIFTYCNLVKCVPLGVWIVKKAMKRRSFFSSGPSLFIIFISLLSNMWDLTIIVPRCRDFHFSARQFHLLTSCSVYHIVRVPQFYPSAGKFPRSSPSYFLYDTKSSKFVVLLGSCSSFCSIFFIYFTSPVSCFIASTLFKISFTVSSMEAIFFWRCLS